MQPLNKAPATMAEARHSNDDDDDHHHHHLRLDPLLELGIRLLALSPTMMETFNDDGDDDDNDGDGGDDDDDNDLKEEKKTDNVLATFEPTIPNRYPQEDRTASADNNDGTLSLVSISTVDSFQLYPRDNLEHDSFVTHQDTTLDVDDSTIPSIDDDSCASLDDFTFMMAWDEGMEKKEDQQ